MNFLVYFNFIYDHGINYIYLLIFIFVNYLYYIYSNGFFGEVWVLENAHDKVYLENV